MTVRRISLLVLVLALLPGWGCTSSYAPPVLTPTGVSVTQESGSGIVVYFNFDATNTNSVELPLRELRYTLWINGEQVFFGVRSPEATLRRLGKQPISFPAVIRVDADHPRPTGPVQYSLDGTLSYLAPGQIAEVLFDLKVRRPTLKFAESGTLDLGNGAPPASEAAPVPTPALTQ